MRLIPISVIFIEVVFCGVSIQNDTQQKPYYDSFITEPIPHIRHRELKKPKDANTRYLDDFRDYCQRPAKCEMLNYTTCMGAKLPYHSTTLDLTDLKSQENVQEKLQLYQYLHFIPNCWAVIQPFLCALYMPKCDKGKVDLPSRQMCRITLEPCKILYNSTIFPEFLNCDDERLFPLRCKNDIQEMKFNTTGYCMDPLVKTDKPDWWYPDIEGCGLRCKDSFYTEDEHNQIHKLIGYCLLICMLLNLFAVFSFIIDWHTGNKYPALAIFYVNLCFCISYGGWLVQFLGADTREDIVCRKDGTIRKSEPSATENLSCVIVFVMVYYFAIAAMVWFVIFSYCWYMSSLQALGKIQERVDRKRAYFHLVAWSFPLIMTITTMAIGEIDGDYVTGICLVGVISKAARTGLLLAPLAATMVASTYIIAKGLILLIKVKAESKEIISEHSSRKIRSNIVRMSIFTLFMTIFCLITFGYHHYLFQNTELWENSLRNYILCKITNLAFDSSHCKQESRPSVAMLQLQLLALFGAGVSMASWVWCDATFKTWGRYIRKKFHCELDEPMKLQKHKIIAQAFAKRKKFNEGGQISILCHNHTDPVGLNFELNSAASNELSTTWAANLARFVNRRGAVPNEIANSISSNNQSIDSEVSLNVRHVSIESRRNSGDSQVSVQIAELKATRKVNSRRRRSTHKQRYYHRNLRNVNNQHHPSKSSKTGKQQGSSTSLDSHMQLINALTNTTAGDIKSFAPNLNRRVANAGLDGQRIQNLLANGRLVIPCGGVGRNNGGSEEENVSVTYSESTINMKLQNNLDLNDELVMKSLRQGLNIGNLDSSSCSDVSKDYEQEKRMKSDRDSHASRRSKRSKRSRKKYNGNCSAGEHSDSSSCSEIKQLVQSSMNSGASTEKNRQGSRQSKMSNDVAVQTDALQDVEMEMKALSKSVEDEKQHKSKRAKTKENKKYRRTSRYLEDKMKRSKERYKEYGSSQERKSLYQDSNRRCSDMSDEELIKEKTKISIRKSTEI